MLRPPSSTLLPYTTLFRSEAIIVRVSDYLDGALGAAERAEVERKIAEDATWKRAHGELTETRKFLSGMRKAHAPSDFFDGARSEEHTSELQSPCNIGCRLL